MTGKHFLKYWQFDNIKNALEHEHSTMKHSASDQYRRVSVGDQLWGCCVTAEDGRLFLFGHMNIDWIGSPEEAAQKPGIHSHILQEGEIQVITADENVEQVKWIDITDIAPQLRFISPIDRDKLELVNGRVNPQQLQKMRRLTPETVKLLRDTWYRTH
jgi:hypothetical protein